MNMCFKENLKKSSDYKSQKFIIEHFVKRLIISHKKWIRLGGINLISLYMTYIFPSYIHITVAFYGH